MYAKYWIKLLKILTNKLINYKISKYYSKNLKSNIRIRRRIFFFTQLINKENFIFWFNEDLVK